MLKALVGIFGLFIFTSPLPFINNSIFGLPAWLVISLITHFIIALVLSIGMPYFWQQLN